MSVLTSSLIAGFIKHASNLPAHPIRYLLYGNSGKGIALAYTLSILVRFELIYTREEFSENLVCMLVLAVAWRISRYSGDLDVKDESSGQSP